MTDNEIIKALECCVECDTYFDECVDGCPLREVNDCTLVLRRIILDLINRQKAEIERLEEENKKQKLVLENINDTIHPLPFVTDFDVAMSQAKSEAIKEFAEQVQEEITNALHSNYKARGEKAQEIPIYTESEFLSYCSGKIDCLRGLADFIDNLVKEMAGDNNE